MENVQLTEVVRQVKIILDENIDMGTIFDNDPDQLQLEELIGARIVDSVRFAHENGERENLSEGLELVGELNTNQDGTGYINLPSNYLRLIVFQLSSWLIPVLEPIHETDPAYLAQKSKFLGVRGGPAKPVCAIANGASGKILEYFSAPPGTTPTIKMARYIPFPEVANSSVKICPKLKTSAYYQCAGFVAATFKDEGATSLFEIAKSYL